MKIYLLNYHHVQKVILQLDGFLITSINDLFKLKAFQRRHFKVLLSQFLTPLRQNEILSSSLIAHNNIIPSGQLRTPLLQSFPWASSSSLPVFPSKKNQMSFVKSIIRQVTLIFHQKPSFFNFNSKKLYAFNNVLVQFSFIHIQFQKVEKFHPLIKFLLKNSYVRAGETVITPYIFVIGSAQRVKPSDNLFKKKTKNAPWKQRKVDLQWKEGFHFQSNDCFMSAY